jgi:asparagine synthase (glutamine-hydrolysing)
MCGIFAAMTVAGVSTTQINAAIKSLHHRGPDGADTWTSSNGRWVLGHTRLSIIGLNNGEQPMKSPDGAIHCIVNGEFYGYRDIRETLCKSGYKFTTDSDSEIALHLYHQRGMQVASELRGEFSVIIADEREQIMVAIRDRFGVKPLYYAQVSGNIYFASEIKTLLALGVPARWNIEGATDGPGRCHEITEFEGIYSVPQGSYAIAKDGKVSIYSYWDWEIPSASDMKQDTRSEAEVVEEFREALLDSVKQRLVADVEVASYLSGGIDSCAVLGLAQQHMDKPIRAFTLTFENPLFDEAAIAEATAKHVGASYHPIPITGQDIADAYSDAIWHSETQMFNGHGVAKFLLSKAVQKAGIKVVFTGEGADEMLGGYPFFRADAVNNNPALSDAEKLAYMDEMFGSNEATRALIMPKQIDNEEVRAIYNRLGWMPSSLNTSIAMRNGLSSFWSDETIEKLQGHQPLVDNLDRLQINQRVKGRDHLNQSLYIHSKTLLPNFILNYLGDRMEMAHSIEGRVPFLDHHVAEVAARVPVDMKVKGIREKHVLREATKDVLIPEVYNRQKHAFTTPPVLDKKDPMLAFYQDTFSSKAAKAQPIFNMQKAQVALSKLLECEPNKRIGMEAGLQRVASAIIMHEKFGMH